MTTLRQLREASGHTQASLARALGVRKSAVSHWETGKRAVSITTARAIATALGCPMADVIAAAERATRSQESA